MALPDTQLTSTTHTQSSLCDKILPRLWKPTVLSVLTAQTQVRVSWVVHGLWRIKSMRAGGGGLVWWDPHHKVISLLLCPTKASSPWHFHRECFPFVSPKKMALFSLVFGCSCRFRWSQTKQDSTFKDHPKQRKGYIFAYVKPIKN